MTNKFLIQVTILIAYVRYLPPVFVSAEWQMSHSVTSERSLYHKQNVDTKGCLLSFTAVIVVAVLIIDNTWFLNGADRQRGKWAFLFSIYVPSAFSPVTAHLII